MGLGDILGGIKEAAIDTGFGIAGGIGRELTFQNSLPGRQNKRDQKRFDQEQSANKIGNFIKILGADSNIRNAMANEPSIQDALEAQGLDRNLIKGFNKLGKDNIDTILNFIQQQSGGTKEQALKFWQGVFENMKGKSVPQIMMALDPFLKQQRAAGSRQALSEIGNQPAPREEQPEPVAPGSPSIPQVDTGRTSATPELVSKVRDILAKELPSQAGILLKKINNLEERMDKVLSDSRLTSSDRDNRVEQLQKRLDAKVKQLGNRLTTDTAAIRNRVPDLKRVLDSQAFKSAFAQVGEELRALKQGKVVVVNGVAQSRQDIIDDFLAEEDFVIAAPLTRRLLRTSDETLALLDAISNALGGG